MKIALYYPWIYLRSGAERVLLEVTGRSRHNWTLFTNRFEPESTFPEFQDRDVVELPRVSVRRNPIAVTAAGLRVLTQRLPIDDYDALVVLTEGVGDWVLFRSGHKPTIAICLTPLRIAFDPVYRRVALAERGFLERTVIRAGCRVFHWADRIAWRHYDHVFCLGNEVIERVIQGGLEPSGKIESLPVGACLRPEDDAEIEYGDFFLLPGRIMWTKNVELGIRAFQHFRDQNPELAQFRLVIAGIVDEKSRPYIETLRQLAGDDPAIEFCVAPSDEALRELYRTCRGVLFSAFNEDWGIVPLEAMAFSKAVIAVDRGGPRETVGHGLHGWLEEPDADAWAKRLAGLAASEDLARSIGQAGRAHQEQFTWDRYTERVDDQLEKLGAR